MPVSKKRKKKGKPVQRGNDRLSGLTLQDLINVVAYQEAHPEEADREVDPEDLIVDDIPTVEDIDFENPDMQAVIRAVAAQSKFNNNKVEDQDGRQ